MTRDEKIAFVMGAMQMYRGDDYARAKAAFRNYTPEQMQQQYGQSGHTCQQILDGYKQQNDEWHETWDWLQGLITLLPPPHAH